MKTLFAVVASLTLATSALADTCFTDNFSASYPTPYPYGGVKLYYQIIDNSYMTATFGGVWRRGWDCDQPGLGNTCHPCTGQGYYFPTPYGGPPGRQREDDSGDFANAPSPGAVAWLPSGWDGHGQADSVQITFNQGVKSVSFWYSSSISYKFWCYGPDSCGYGQDCTIGGPLEPNPGPAQVKFLGASGVLGLIGQASLDQPGTRYETGCSGDPLGSACKWTKVTFTDPNPSGRIRRIRFEMGALGPFFMDDLQVCVTGSSGGGCGQPPCILAPRSTAEPEAPAKRISWGRIKVIYR